MSVKLNRPTAASVLALCACGSKVDSPEDWMIGVFSTQQVDGAAASVVQRFYLHDDLSADFVQEQPGAETQEFHYKWEPRGDEQFAILANTPPDYLITEGAELVVTRGGECGPHVMEEVHEGVPSADWQIFRGEVCVRLVDGSDPGTYDAYWCNEPPSACGEGQES